MEILAQGEVTNAQVGAALAVVLFIFSLIIAARKVFGHEPPLHKEYATKESHAELRKEIEKIDHERRSSAAKLHDKIEALGKGQAALESATATQTRQLHALDGKIENLPEKILRLMDRRP